jgi:RNA polymerase sigma-70 factor, ECF subfamily
MLTHALMDSFIELPIASRRTNNGRAMSAVIDEPTDERLIRSTLAGDDEAFAGLVRRHKPRVFGIAARFARNDHELDDICQEIRHDRENVSLDGIEIGTRDNVSARDAAEILHWAMTRLSADERLVITLLELEEKSVRETAELTGWSESNVKVRAFRARQTLKTILETSHER